MLTTYISEGQSSLLNLLIQLLISSRDTLIDTPRSHALQLFGISVPSQIGTYNYSAQLCLLDLFLIF